mmetsp:Transcript_1125/g.2503  ORF Transcript_1125/g.2503 Transcript_1125/m.2503 type:complete len:224 (-) Transcript_1125:751-1422(-)
MRLAPVGIQIVRPRRAISRPRHRDGPQPGRRRPVRRGIRVRPAGADGGGPAIAGVRPGAAHRRVAGRDGDAGRPGRRHGPAAGADLQVHLPPGRGQARGGVPRGAQGGRRRRREAAAAVPVARRSRRGLRRAANERHDGPLGAHGPPVRDAEAVARLADDERRSRPDPIRRQLPRREDVLGHDAGRRAQMHGGRGLRGAHRRADAGGAQRAGPAELERSGRPP